MALRNLDLSWLAVSAASLFLWVSLGFVGCLPAESDDDSRCDSGEEYTQYKGVTACRTTCVENSDCTESGMTCTKGVCVETSSPPPDADSGPGSDTGPVTRDTGPCSADARLTIYHGVKKCRPFCSNNDDCSGSLECEDGHCIDRSLKAPDTSGMDTGVSGDSTSDTGGGGYDVSSGTLTCREIAQCRLTCSSQSCAGGYVGHGKRMDERAYKAFTKCVDNNCPNRRDSCIENKCGQEQKTCFPENKVTGNNLSCSEFRKCIANCPTGDTMCERNCRNSRSTQAENEWMAIISCLQGPCPQFGQQCVRNALAGQCAKEWRTCFDCPSNP